MIPCPVEILTDNTSLCRWILPGQVRQIVYDKDRDGISCQEAFGLYQNEWNEHWWLDFGGWNITKNTNHWYLIYNAIKDNYNTPTVYTHSCVDDGTIFIQYWFYYPFNDWAGDHEGDWFPLGFSFVV